ncbi:hypothetical protein B296_00023824, partial [Ensete ventricosum]
RDDQGAEFGALLFPQYKGAELDVVEGGVGGREILKRCKMAGEVGRGGDGGVVVGRMKLGSRGLEVSRQGLGCMSMSAFYGLPPKPETDMIALVHSAIRSGVTFFDTFDIYGPCTNEILLGKVLLIVNNCASTDGSRALVSGVGTARRLEGESGVGHKVRDQLPGREDGDPAYVRAACEGSLQRLGIDCIDLYYQHRVDTRVPIEVTVS